MRWARMGSEMGAAIYFDGKLARRTAVALRVGIGHLDLIGEDGRQVRWPFASIRELEALPGQMKLRSVDEPELANLVVSDVEAIAQVRARLPAIPHDHSRHRTPAAKIIGLSVAAVASVVGIIVFIIPLMAGLIADNFPPLLERRLGDSVAVQVKDMFSADVCTSPAGTRALNKLSAALTDKSDLRHPVRIDVLNTKVLNAIALPGGQVFLFDGLLEKAENVDEIAGVLGHEIGHEHARDGLRGMVRSGGTAFLLGLLFGDVTGSWGVIYVTRQLLDSAHSREAETKADDFGRDVMHALERPASDMARLLVRISGEEGKRGSIFASHPMSKDRLARLEKADGGAAGALRGEPLLTAGEWRALKNICVKD